jgi:hypothetical protein
MVEATQTVFTVNVKWGKETITGVELDKAGDV